MKNTEWLEEVISEINEILNMGYRLSSDSPQETIDARNMLVNMRERFWREKLQAMKSNAGIELTLPCAAEQGEL